MLQKSDQEDQPTVAKPVLFFRVCKALLERLFSFFIQGFPFRGKPVISHFFLLLFPYVMCDDFLMIFSKGYIAPPGSIYIDGSLPDPSCYRLKFDYGDNGRYHFMGRTEIFVLTSVPLSISTTVSNSPQRCCDRLTLYKSEG